jgi:sugar diacid utilization regulator
VAKNFIIFRRVLDCPDEKTVDWLIVWVTYKGDIKITALELGIEINALYKRIERLDKIYKQKRELLAG